MIIEIPTKPYISKYLCCLYGPQMKLSKGNAFGLLTWHILRNELVDTQYNVIVENYTSIYRVQVTKKEVFRERVRNLNSYSVIKLNALLDDIFKQNFYVFMDALSSTGIEQKKAIYLFLEKYQFTEEELSYETLKKSFYRYQKNRKTSTT